MSQLDLFYKAFLFKIVGLKKWSYRFFKYFLVETAPFGTFDALYNPISLINGFLRLNLKNLYPASTLFLFAARKYFYITFFWCSCISWENHVGRKKGDKSWIWKHFKPFHLRKRSNLNTAEVKENSGISVHSSNQMYVCF